MATNADLVKKAESMGITGYDKTTASATGPGTDGRATLRSGGGSGGGGSRGTGSAGARSGLVSDAVSQSSGRLVQVGSDGNAPAGTRVGDTVRTAGGDYKVVSPNTPGASYNPSSGLWSIKQTGGSGGSAGGAGGSSGTSGDKYGKYYDKAGNYIGPVNDWGVDPDIYAEAREATRLRGGGAKYTPTGGRNYDSAGNYTGPVNDWLRTIEVDDRAKEAIAGMDAEAYANLRWQLRQLGVTLGGGSVPEWDTKSRRSFEFERGKQVESPSGQQQLDRYDHYDQRRHEEMLRQILEAALAQQNAKIDYATRQQAEDLNRAVADAEKQYQAQRDAVALDEARALDNSALYAELRGDRGGIGRAQYDSIQNTAAQNRQLIRQAQTQMASDAARQIADLRAHGEFEKADALLQSTQSYLQQLMQLEQYALEYNLNVDQLNNALTQWESEWALKNQRYAIEDARYSDETAYNRDQAEMSRSAQLAQSLLESGIPLTDMQREALGITKEQEATMSNLYMLQAAEKAASSRKSGGGGGGGDGSKDGKDTASDGIYETMKAKGIKTSVEAYNYLKNTQKFTDTAASEYAADYLDWLPQSYVEAANKKAHSKFTNDEWLKIAYGLYTDWTKAGYTDAEIRELILQQRNSGMPTDVAETLAAMTQTA